MNSILTALLIFCSGPTATYDVLLNFYPQEHRADVTLIDSDATNGASSFQEIGEFEEDCFVSRSLEICFLENDQASLKLELITEHAETSEGGLLSCEAVEWE